MDFTNISKNPIMLKEENKRFAFERDRKYAVTSSWRLTETKV